MWKWPKNRGEVETIFQELQGAHEERSRQFAIVRQRGAARYVARKTARLWPQFTVVLGLAGLVAARSDARRLAMARELGLPWGVSLLVIAIALALILSALIAAGLWLLLKRRIFPRLPAER